MIQLLNTYSVWNRCAKMEVLWRGTLVVRVNPQTCGSQYGVVGRCPEQVHGQELRGMWFHPLQGAIMLIFVALRFVPPVWHMSTFSSRQRVTPNWTFRRRIPLSLRRKWQNITAGRRSRPMFLGSSLGHQRLITMVRSSTPFFI